MAIHQPAARDQGVHIHLHCPNVTSTIDGDPGQLVQLFVNLLNNAIEAMPNGGDILITVAHSSPRLGSNTITVTIADQGVGIPVELRPKIFQPFFTTKPSGTGLGLSISKEIADFHHARLALLPGTDGVGVVAHVAFPCLQDADGEPRITAGSRVQMQRGE